MRAKSKGDRFRRAVPL
jgi:hypothetical protein